MLEVLEAVVTSGADMTIARNDPSSNDNTIDVYERAFHRNCTDQFGNSEVRRGIYWTGLLQ